MRVAIYHPFTHFPDNYSLAHVVREQMMMITEEGWECHFYTHERFSSPLPEGVILHAILPSRNGKTLASALAKSPIAEMDCVLTHDVAYIDVYSDHAAAIRKMAKEHPNIKWFHWAHSAPSPNNKHEPIPNSTYIGMNYTDIMLLAEQFQVPVAKCQVVYNPRSPDVFWGWHQETKEFVDKHDLLNVDILLYYPFDTGRFDAKGGGDIIALTNALNKSGVKTKTVFINAAANTDARRRLVDGWIKRSPDIIFTSKELPEWEVTCPNWFVREIGSISDALPLFSKSEGCSLIMLEAGLMGNLFMFNEDFPPLREFANADEALSFKLSSTRQETTYHPNKEAYINDMATILVNELKQNKSLRFRRKTLKRFNRGWIWNNQLKPLLEN